MKKYNALKSIIDRYKKAGHELHGMEELGWMGCRSSFPRINMKSHFNQQCSLTLPYGRVSFSSEVVERATWAVHSLFISFTKGSRAVKVYVLLLRTI